MYIYKQNKLNGQKIIIKSIFYKEFNKTQTINKSSVFFYIFFIYLNLLESLIFIQIIQMLNLKVYSRSFIILTNQKAHAI